MVHITLSANNSEHESGGCICFHIWSTMFFFNNIIFVDLFINFDSIVFLEPYETRFLIGNYLLQEAKWMMARINMVGSFSCLACTVSLAHILCGASF